ncbi:MAG: hypothetical protein JWR33_1694 [Naasia sp.]|uniref:YhgE/Pip family protein n=1 Tax=Naasia sp. TaxID=2546198 RepID=UPI00261662CC|nr:YhgE/Pip domain-containing protein [Naasia sp.]MCU1570953.1 hypothetical protein [Naasia sp.]
MTSLASRPAFRVLAILALLLVPLAVVGMFAGSLSAVGSENARIPAAIVNEDRIVNQTAADGTTSPVLAGRLLVTALTGDDAPGGAGDTFDWTITGATQAKDALANGEVYAVLTVPKNFSRSIVSLSSDTPEQAHLTLTTDDSHGYVTGPLTDVVGDGLAALFGDQISEQFIGGLISGTGQFGTALSDAADGAAQLQSGSRDLADGLDKLSDGASAAQDGAARYTDGIAQYTGGVSTLRSGIEQYAGGVSSYADGVEQFAGGVSDLSDGLATAASQSAGLQDFPDGVDQYTGGVTQSADGLNAILDNPAAVIDPQTRAALEQLAAGLEDLSDSGPALVDGAHGAADLQSGVSDAAAGAAQLDSGAGDLISGAQQLDSGATSLADGAQQLASGGDALVSGAQGITGGIGTLAEGTAGAADGADKLGDGAGQLADGLTKGADAVPSYSDDQADTLARIAAAPIGLDAVRTNQVSSIPQIVSTLLVPAGLWIGALAVFLALGGATRRLLASPASSTRIGGYVLLRAGLLVAGQAMVLVVLLHTGINVPWSALPATLPFALLVAVVFTCIHAALTATFGRWGAIASLVLLALQLAATGGLYPVEVLSAPFRALSPLLPLTEALNGMQAIVTGNGPGEVISAALALAVWGTATSALTVFALSRARSARSLGLVPAAA